MSSRVVQSCDGGTEEPTADGAEQAEQSVHDVILEMLDQDPGLDAGVKDAVLDALAEVVGQAQDEAETHTAPTFLTSISVVGFRGIGPQARLDLYPAPGLMVVSGRNGSGKSSFAEALELALTGTSYRWHKKEVLWTESWRNLHRSDPCAIRVGFTAEGSGPFTVGVDWAPGDAAHRADDMDAGRIGASKSTVPMTSAGRAHWNCGARCCPTTNWAGSSTADRRRCTTRWPSCSASKCWPTPRNGLLPN